MPYLFLILSFVFINFCTATPVSASTDPFNATVSATATVPTTAATTGDTSAPSSVVLYAPHDGTITNQTRPEFVWRQTFDNNSNYTLYTLKLNNVATYLGISNTGNTQQSNYISRLSEGYLYLTPTIDLTEGTYLWSVDAYDLSNNTSHSTTWSLTIDTTPPPIILNNIDDTYLNPPLSEGSIFDLYGTQDVTLTFTTEPWATISLNITLPQGAISSISIPTNASGIATTTFPLPLGSSEITTSSFDSAGLTTVYPTFILRVQSVTLTGLLSLEQLPPVTILANDLPIIQLLPTTISQIELLSYISINHYLMLAIILILLLIYAWKKKPNILIVDSNTQQPFRSLIVYHSRPTSSTRFIQTLGHLLITKKSPNLYSVNSTGKLYIKNLGRYSTLTIRMPDGLTSILSLTTDQQQYTLSL